MNEKLTLNQTWTLCLRMWKWIVKQCEKDNDADVWDLKEEWLNKNYPNFLITNDCFFCRYDIQQKDDDCCEFCPGKLVSKRFLCSRSTYNWENKPIKFYQKLVELNKKRKSKE